MTEPHIPAFLLRNKRLGMNRVGYASYRYRGILIRRSGQSYAVESFNDHIFGVERFDRLWKAREYADWLAEARAA
jgi:hypothetical protein